MPGIVTFQLSQNVYAQTPAQTPPEPGPPADCKEMVSLWSHTYGHPGGQPKPITWSRFVEHKPTSAPDDCVVAKGVIENTPSVATDEHDGDYHFLLTPDTGYKNLLNHFNTKGLMVEIICWDKSDIAPTYFSEYGDYCKGVDDTGHYPANLIQGDHVEVIGKWVQDVGHPTPGHPAHEAWNEIHPATAVFRIK